MLLAFRKSSIQKKTCLPFHSTGGRAGSSKNKCYSLLPAVSQIFVEIKQMIEVVCIVTPAVIDWRLCMLCLWLFDINILHVL